MIIVFFLLFYLIKNDLMSFFFCFTIFLSIDEHNNYRYCGDFISCVDENLSFYTVVTFLNSFYYMAVSPLGMI